MIIGEERTVTKKTRGLVPGAIQHHTLLLVCSGSAVYIDQTNQMAQHIIPLPHKTTFLRLYGTIIDRSSFELILGDPSCWTFPHGMNIIIILWQQQAAVNQKEQRSRCSIQKMMIEKLTLTRWKLVKVAPHKLHTHLLAMIIWSSTTVIIVVSYYSPDNNN